MQSTQTFNIEERVLNFYKQKNHKNLKELFKSKQANPNQLYTDSDGNQFYLLTKAIEDHDFKLVKILLNSGVDINLINKEGKHILDINAHLFENGDTLLHWAFRRNFSQIQDTLIRQGANPNIKNYMGEIPSDIRKSYPVYIPREDGSNFRIYKPLHFNHLKLSPAKSDLKNILIEEINFTKSRTIHKSRCDVLRKEIDNLESHSPEDFLEVLISLYEPMACFYLNHSGTLVTCIKKLAKYVLSAMTLEELNGLKEKLTEKLRRLNGYEGTLSYQRFLKILQQRNCLMDEYVLHKGCELIDNLLKEELNSRNKKSILTEQPPKKNHDSILTKIKREFLPENITITFFGKNKLPNEDRGRNPLNEIGIANSNL